MKSAVEQLSTYKSVHLNPKNIRTHFIGIPLIIWSIVTLLSRIDLYQVNEFFIVNASILLVLILMMYYSVLHRNLSFGMGLFFIPILLSTEVLRDNPYIIYYAIGAFVIGWIFQFIGHYYEKAKPAFIDDINQLFIGPFFMMAEFYFMLGYEKKLNEEITPIALKKRKEFEKKQNT